MDKRAGSYRTNLSGEAAYRSFVPAPLPPNPPIEFHTEAMDLLAKAKRQLVLLEDLVARTPSARHFVPMFMRKEALLSCQIEGIQATLEDVLDPISQSSADQGVEDAKNCVRAMDYAVGRLQDLPLCNRLIKEAHGVLMQGRKGQGICPGEFRKTQNWIGRLGSTLGTAIHIPPTPRDMEKAMSELENYYREDGGLDVLVRAALIHYQFESIHPFLDGNGRIGRLFNTLYLMDKGVLKAPVLCISRFLKENRTEYYDRMTEVRKKGNYEQWVKFFLHAIHVSAENATETIDRLTALHDRNVANIGNMRRGTKAAMLLFAYLESNPIIDIQNTASALALAHDTVTDAVGHLSDLGILQRTGSVGCGTEAGVSSFAYSDYLEIWGEGTL